MQELTTKYQLCRMVLINAGTNMHVPSGRITAIDPRGGAAVLGDNGVGKTTTLRILPLFFGHLPSQIVAAGHGQEAMVRFVLPTDASAIAFEYQRGSTADGDTRLAVIRRRSDDPDVPFYRLYRSGFRKELFVDEGRFLSDDETQLKATNLGIPTTSKLSTSEYRSVILRTPAASKEREKLRRFAVEWSFGPKQLDNLDRVVAAMVKKHINFADIVQVAVGLVQHDLGQGAERAKLTFKQGKAPIERWLRNREACADAFRLAPIFSELDDDLRDHRAAEARFRSCRADVATLRAAREQEAGELTKTLEALAAARATALDAERLRRTEMTEAASLAAHQASSAKASFDDADLQARRFETGKAAHWEKLVEELPGLKARVQTLDAQIVAAESVQAEATARYERLQSEAKTQTGEQCLALERSKEPHRMRLGESQRQIAAAEVEALKLCDDEAVARRQELDDQLEPLQGQLGTWSARRNSPAASEEAVREAEEAEQRLQRHLEDVNQVQQVAGNATNELQAATHAFERQEAEVRKSKSDLATARSGLAEVQARLNPPEGTFLAALRSHPSDDWKRNLAKVINPDLLGRDDLDSTAAEEAAHSLYGWQLNTGVIAAPDWTDDALARQAVETTKARVASAEARAADQDSELAKRSRTRDDATLKVQTSQARLTVLKNQTDERKNQRDAARKRVETEKRDARDTAAAEFAKVQTSIDDLKKQRKSLDRDNATSRAAVNAAHDKQRAAAQRLCGEAVAAIDAQATRLQQDLANTLRDLAEQLNEHLSKAGVDVKRLESLRGEVGGLRKDIRDREDRQALVEAWKAWLETGGATRVETLKAAAARAAAASGAAAARVTEVELAAEKSAREHGVAVGLHERRQSDVADELKVLGELDEGFGDYLASGESVIDPKTSARDLRSKVRTVRAEIDKLEEAINRRTSTLRQALTAKSSAVKEFVDASLEQAVGDNVISRATALSLCYRQVGPQVANDVNLTLKTLLANIGAFQKAIQAFEREVATFNRRLQEGLTEVKCFERVKDLRLDIVTNFEGLGFYKKLSRMEDVVRLHANEVGKDYTRELPPDETARALGEFMSVLGSDGNVEVNLSSHITLKGSVSDNGQHKEFKRANELENISSEGLTSLVLITLMTALLNTIRGTEPVHVPWVTDEVGKFDPKNFRALMQKLRDNRIDVVTASPELGPTQQAMFAQRYLFEDRGRIREYRPLDSVVAGSAAPAMAEVEQ
ncbi:MAG: ATP-binding protein [Rhizobacter sp.]|nr:ATP-binding protein [Rhizobacter sp.]